MYWPYVLGIAVILYLVGSLRVLRQYERGVVFLLGKFEGVRGPGLTLIFIPIQQMVRVSLRTVTMQIPSQKIITKDNVSIDIAAVAYYHISDPEKAVIVIENVYNAINQISQTTVRNVVGRFSLDQLLSDTASINLQIKNVIDGHTEPWGTQVTAVEIKDIVFPDNMQRAMAKEAEAERERRAKIVAAEGEYQAAVKLGQAADIITQHPVALQLRTLQTMAEISVEKNSTIIFPAQFMTRHPKLSRSFQRIQHLNSVRDIFYTPDNTRFRVRSIAPDVTSGERAVCSHYSLYCYKPIAEPLDKFIKRKGGINECASRFTRCLHRRRRKWREPREIVLVV